MMSDERNTFPPSQAKPSHVHSHQAPFPRTHACPLLAHARAEGGSGSTCVGKHSCSHRASTCASLCQPPAAAIGELYIDFQAREQHAAKLTELGLALHKTLGLAPSDPASLLREAATGGPNSAVATKAMAGAKLDLARVTAAQRRRIAQRVYAVPASPAPRRLGAGVSRGSRAQEREHFDVFLSYCWANSHSAQAAWAASPQCVMCSLSSRAAMCLRPRGAAC